MTSKEQIGRKAELVYATAPTPEQLSSLKEAVRRRYGLEPGELELATREDKSLGDGFILHVGNDVYDWSRAGRQQQFRDFIEKTRQDEALLKNQEIISILKTRVENFELQAKKEQVGTVVRVGDGIARVTGLDLAMYGEVVVFDSGVKGMVQDLRVDSVGVILFGHEDEVGEGSRVVHTGKRAGVPVGEQFLLYMKNIAHGDFGVSAKTGREISATINSKFKVSAKMGILAVLLAVVEGVFFGSIAALQRNKWPDRVIIFISTLFTSLPSFVLGSFLLVIFSVKLGWVQAWSPQHQSLILPVLSLAAYPAAYITRLTKTSMLDVLGQDYVRTARAKGVREGKVLFVHTLRNALIPVVTYVGPMIASVLTGSLVVEQIFTVGGLGNEFVQSITNRDYPMIMGVTIFLAVFMVTMNLITDIVYKLIDPRITLE